MIKNRGSDELTRFPFPWDNARMTKARSQRAGAGRRKPEAKRRNGVNGQLQRSGMFVVPRATKSISPVGAACSAIFSDDVACGRSLGSLGGDGSTNMSALTGPTVLVPLVPWWLSIHILRVKDLLKIHLHLNLFKRF